MGQEFLLQLLASLIGSGGAVWLVLKIKFRAIDQRIDDAKETGVRAHTRIDNIFSIIQKGG